MKKYAFIFARGGSKGLPRKNVLPLGGIPLIEHSIRTAFETELFERVIVSTDDAEIAEVASKAGADVPFMRPEELARDDAPEWLAWQHAVKMVDDFDIFVSLPATSPLRSTGDVKRCVETYLAGEVDVVLTVRQAERHPSFNMVTLDDNGYAALAMPLEKSITRRQDAPAVYDLTTVAYVTSPDFILNHTGIMQGRCKCVEIPPERAVDIDTPFDFKFAEFLIQSGQV